MSGVVTAVALVAYSALANVDDASQRRYVVRNVAAGLLLVAMARRRGLTWDQVALSPSRIVPALRMGARRTAASAAAVAIATIVASRHPSGRRLLADRRADVPPRELWWQTLVRIPVGTAAFEEVAFRGVLLGLLADAHGERTGVWASSVTFGLWHVAPTVAALRINGVAEGRARASAAAVAVTTVAGVVLGRMRLKDGHVVTPWLTHWVINALALAAAARWQSTRRAAT